MTRETPERTVIHTLPPWLGDVDVLLDELRAKQFNIGIGEHTKVILLLDRLEKQQVVIETAEQLLAWLAPVICLTQQQNETLALSLKERQTRYGFQQEELIAPVAAAPASPQPNSKPRSLLWIIGVTVSIAISIVLGIYFWQSDQSKDVTVTPIEQTQNKPAQEQAGLDLNRLFSFSSPSYSKEYVLQILLAFFFVAWSMRRIYKLRRKTLKLARKMTNQALSERPIYYHLDLVNLFSGAELSHPLQILRKHIEVSSHELDVSKSLAATIQSGGQIVIKEGTRPQLPEYLLLTRKTSSEDHHSTLAQNLAQRLLQEQIHVNRMDYSLDPRRCRDQYGHVVNLAEMQGGQAHQRLLIVADAEEFFVKGSYHPQPWFDLIQRWHWAAVLTPKPYKEWGKREMLLVELGVYLQPISTQGIQTLAKQLQEESEPSSIRAGGESAGLWRLLDNNPHRWTHSHVPEDGEIKALMKELEHALSQPAFELLSCMAVLPVLTPNLTLYLAQALHDLNPKGFQNTTLEEVFGYLSRLPWFRVGYMPDWLRVQLIDTIPYQLSGRVKSICQSMIANDLSQKDANFVLKIADQDQSQWKRLLKGIYKFGDDTEWHDYIFLGFLEGNSKLDLEVKKDSQLRKSALPSVSAKEVRYGLYGILPALLLLPNTAFVNSIMVMLLSPLSQFTNYITSQYNIISIGFSYSTMTLFLLLIISFNKKISFIASAIKFVTPIPFAFALFSVVISGVSSNIELLLLSGSFLGLFWVKFGTNTKTTSAITIGDVRNHWVGGNLMMSIAVLSFVINLVLYKGAIDTYLSLGLLATSFITAVYPLARYWLGFWRGLSTVWMFFIVFIGGLYSVRMAFSIEPLMAAIVAFALSVTITANYLVTFLKYPEHKGYVQSLNQMLLPWLLLSYFISWVIWWPLSDFLNVNSAPQSALGIGVFLWLSAVTQARQRYHNNQALMRPFMLWGGSLLIASTLLAWLLSKLEVKLLGSADLWSLLLLVPLARLYFPNAFRGPLKKTIEKERAPLFVIFLPLFWLLPIGLAWISTNYELYSAGTSYAICLVPYTVWLANKYGYKAHWVFAPIYLFCAAIASMGSTLDDFFYEPRFVAGVFTYLILYNFIIYLAVNFKRVGEFVQVNKLSYFQWFFLIVIFSLHADLIANEMTFVWNGVPLAMALWLLVSVSNVNFRPALVVLSVGFVANFAVDILLQSSQIDAATQLMLFPSYIGEIAVFLVCLLGFRWAYRLRSKSGWLTLVVLLLLPLQMFNLHFSLTDMIGATLNHPYLLPIVCLLAGVTQTSSMWSFSLPIVIVTVALMGVPLFLGETYGDIGLIGFVTWNVDYVATFFFTASYILFYMMGKKCQSMLGEKDNYLLKIQDMARARNDQEAYDREMKESMMKQQTAEQSIPNQAFDETVYMHKDAMESVSFDQQRRQDSELVRLNMLAAMLPGHDVERVFPFFKLSTRNVAIVLVVLVAWFVQLIIHGYETYDSNQASPPIQEIMPQQELPSQEQKQSLPSPQQKEQRYIEEEPAIETDSRPKIPENFNIEKIEAVQEEMPKTSSRELYDYEDKGLESEREKRATAY